MIPVALCVSLLALASSAAPNTSSAQLLLQPNPPAISVPTSSPATPGRPPFPQDCLTLLAGHPASAALPHVRTTLRTDPATGWGVVVAELLGPAGPAGAPRAVAELTNVLGTYSRIETHRKEYLAAWQAEFPDLVPAEVDAMLSCARLRARDWHAPLPRHPRTCQHTPSSLKGTPTFMQTSMQLDYTADADRVVVSLYQSAEDAAEAVRVLLHGDPFGRLDRGVRRLETDRVEFGPWPATAKRWAEYRAEYVESSVGELPGWRSAEELGAMVDCARERVEWEAAERSQ